MQIFLLRVLAKINFRTGMAFGALLGRVLCFLLPARRHVVEVNLKHCFPDLDQPALKKKSRKVFEENGRGVVETAWAWYAPRSRLLSRVTYNDIDVVQERLKAQAVLLCCPHVSMLDTCAPILSEKFGKFVVTYRPHKKSWLEKEIVARRSGYCELINVRDIRKIANRLREPGTLVWFAPDQDMGENGTVVANFFGKPASTVTTPSRLAAMSNCAVATMYLYRNDLGYYAGFEMMPDDFPSGNSVVDAQTLNTAIEAAVLHQSDQYLWLHRRFKSIRDDEGRSIYG